MPKVYLTQEDRQKAGIQKIRESIADGIASKKNRFHFTNIQLAKEFGVGPKRISKLLDSEDIEMNVNEFLRLLHFSGHKIVKTDSNL